MYFVSAAFRTALFTFAAKLAFREYFSGVVLWIKRKRANDIVYNQNLQQIVNKPIALYVIPYEEFSTYETDVVGKLDYRVRLYWKDV
jgi:hypothetical protein